MKKLILPLLIVGAMGAGIGYYLYQKPVASLEKKKPDAEVSAGDVIQAYEADEKTANDKYLGKVLQVTGQVAEISSKEGKHKIFLDTGNPMSMIICELEEGHNPGPLKAGDQATVKGMCSGYLSDVILVQSVIVNP